MLYYILCLTEALWAVLVLLVLVAPVVLVERRRPQPARADTAGSCSGGGRGN